MVKYLNSLGFKLSSNHRAQYLLMNFSKAEQHLSQK